MHITYDMRIGSTEMVIKNIIDSLANVGRTSVRQKSLCFNEQEHEATRGLSLPITSNSV